MSWAFTSDVVSCRRSRYLAEILVLNSLVNYWKVSWICAHGGHISDNYSMRLKLSTRLKRYSRHQAISSAGIQRQK